MLSVVPCRYLPSPSLFLQPISPSLLSHISSDAVPHILRRRIHPCCPASLPQCSFAAVFTSDLVCHPYFPRLCCSPYHIIFNHSVYFAAVVCLPSPVVSSPCSASFFTTLLDLLCSTLIFSLSPLIFSLQFPPHLARLFYLSVMFSLCSDMQRFSPLAFTQFCSNFINSLRSVCSNMLSPYLICSTLITLLMLWFACSYLLGSTRSDMIYFLLLWTF